MNGAHGKRRRGGRWKAAAACAALLCFLALAAPMPVMPAADVPAEAPAPAPAADGASRDTPPDGADGPAAPGDGPVLQLADGLVPDASNPGVPASAAEAAGAGPVQDVRDLDVPEIEAEHEPGVVLVQVAEGVSAAELRAALEESGCVQADGITDADVQSGFVELAVDGGYDVEHALLRLQSVPQVGASQPNYLYRLLDDAPGSPGSAIAPAIIDDGENDGDDGSSPDDPGGEGEGDDDPDAAEAVDDPRAASQWALESVGAYRAWHKAKADRQVTVAVIDTGCLLSHEDLQGNLILEDGEPVAFDATDASGVGDIKGHGTHVAGIIAAEANNATGIAGVSYNARLLPVQVFTEDDAGDLTASSASISAAYRYLIDNAGAYNIRVANMSLGAPHVDGTAFNSNDSLLISAVEGAYDAGILTVCASGNEAEDYNGDAYHSFPSDYLEHAIGVIALQNGAPPTRTPYSNYNMAGESTKELSAPGSGILSTYNHSDDSYATLDGTSMAAPCVAGIAALVFAANPNLSPGQVKDILCSSATDLGAKGWDEGYGYGEVNASAAVDTSHLYLEGDSSMLVGGSLTLSPSLGDDWSWTSSDTSIATVAGGVVSGAGGGTAVITATSGSVSISKTVTVYDISFSGASEVEAGSYIDIAFNENPTTGMWLIDCSDTDVAIFALGDDGLRVFGRTAGTVAITATLESNEALQVSHEVVVNAATTIRSLDDVLVGWPESVQDMMYSGEALTPVPGAVLYPTQAALHYNALGLCDSLTAGTDYDIAYEDNVDAGTMRVVLTGKGIYEGTRVAEFAIAPRPVDQASPDPWQGDFPYTGAALTPVPVLRYNGAALAEGADFSLEYRDNVDAGGACAVIAGQGNFTGTVEVPFTIEPANLDDAQVALDGWTYDGREHEPQVTVTIGGNVVPAADYTVAYAGNRDAGTCTATVAPSGTGNCTGSASGACTVARRSVTLESAGASRAYDGTPLASPQVGVSGDGFVAGEVSGLRATGSVTDVGRAVNAIAYTEEAGFEPGNYDLSLVEGTLEVTAVPIAGDGVSAGAAGQVYTGSALVPEPALAFGSRTLVAGKDYAVVSYRDNVDAGEAAVTVEGRGNFSGTRDIPFAIEPADLSQIGLDVSGLGRETYDGGEHMPRPALGYRGAALAEGRDYVIASYRDNVDAGEACAVIAGQGNFTGTVEVPFTIEPASLDGAQVSLDGWTYDGREHEPRVTVTIGGNVVPAADYTVAYAGNRDAGTCTATVTGAGGNRVGSASGTCTVARRSVTLESAGASRAYDGTPLASPQVGVSGDGFVAGEVSALRATGSITGAGSVVNTIAYEESAAFSAGNYDITLEEGTLTVEPADIAGDGVSAEVAAQTYTGAALTPEPALALAATALVAGADYAVISYRANVDAGEAAVTVEGRGNFSGTRDIPFAIEPADLSQIGLDVSGLGRETYDGGEHTPRPALGYRGAALAEGRDYVIASYRDNDRVGTATVTVEGRGNFSGTRSLPFVIGLASLDGAQVSLDGWTYDGQAHEPRVTVTLDGDVVPAGEYTVSYAGNIDAGTCTATVTGAGGDYEGEASGTCTVARRSVTLSSGSLARAYDGAALTSPQVGVSGDGFVAGEVSGLRATGSVTDVGSAANAITYKEEAGFKAGNYLVEKDEGTLTVTPAPLAGAIVTAPAQAYTGAALTPAPTVILGGRTLRAGSDYSVVSHAGNIDAGTATVTVRGTGNYTGRAAGSFQIAPRPLSQASIASIAVQYRTGGAIEPHPAVSWDGAALAEGHDCTLSWSGNVNAGMATVTATGIGNYAGTASATFRIIDAPTWSGATQLPVGATAAYTVGGGGSIRVISGGTCVGLSGKTLSAKRAGTARLGLYDSLGRLYATRTVTVYRPSGNYVVQSALAPSLVYDIEGKSKKANARMIVWTRNGGKNQKFQLVAQADGTYAIKCLHSGKYVSVKGGSKASGAKVVQAKWKKNAAYERWRITVDASNRLTFVNRASGKVLDVDGARAVKGRGTIIWPSNNGLNQKWILKRS